MILTAQEEYGLRCALSLARAGREESLTLSRIAVAEGLTTAYAGKLMRLPASIKVSEVVGPLGGPFYDGEICTRPASASALCVHNNDCAVRSLWSGMQGMIDSYLAQVSLSDLVRAEATMERTMEEIRERTVVEGER